MSTADDGERLDSIEAALLKRWPETRIQPSLDRINLLADALGSPQLSYPTIHIAGTNGKTSTSRMIDCLLFELGLRTGRFTSPHLESFLERISINGDPISPAGMIATYNDMALYLDLADSRSQHPVSFFEAMTALAFVAFAEFPVDVGIFECGMGGEWDATNVVSSAVAVITPIGLDHTEYLGSTIAEIAETKSGIIKVNSFAVLARQEPEVALVLMKRCAQMEALPLREGIEFSLVHRAVAVGGQMINIQGVNGLYSDIFLPLHGAHQGSNAAVALAAVEAMMGEEKLDEDVVRNAFARVRSPGRCEILMRKPTVMVDAAHNPHGATALVETLKHEFDFSSLIVVVAPMGDKDIAGILTTLATLETLIDKVILTKNSSTRAAPLDLLRSLADEIFGSDRVRVIPTLGEAITESIQLAKIDNDINDGNCAVIITGSVVSVGESKTFIRQMSKELSREKSDEMRD